MSVVDSPPKKRVFIAASLPDVAEVRKAMERFGLDAVTLEESAAPGTSWIDGLHQCMGDADLVIGIMGDKPRNANVFFELGVASALNKPTLLFITPDYPIGLIPPSGIPFLRLDLRDEDAVMFGLKQALSLTPRAGIRKPTGGFTTRPIDSVADDLISRLSQAGPLEFEELIYEAIEATGASTIARGSRFEDSGADFAVWSSDLEPTMANPLLIECKLTLPDESAVNEAIGRMARALDSIPNGRGIVLYRDAGKISMTVPRSLPISLVSAEDFINGLRDAGLAEYLRKLPNSAPNGS